MDYLKMLEEGLEKIPEKVKVEERFKLPEPIIFYQGNKTVFANFKEFVEIIRRDEKHFAKFLFKELATPGVIQNNHLVFNSKIRLNALKRKIEEYLNNFVYCRVCGSPDTKLTKENRFTFMVCEACGAKNPIKKI